MSSESKAEPTIRPALFYSPGQVDRARCEAHARRLVRQGIVPLKRIAGPKRLKRATLASALDYAASWYFTGLAFNAGIKANRRRGYKPPRTIDGKVPVPFPPEVAEKLYRPPKRRPTELDMRAFIWRMADIAEAIGIEPGTAEGETSTGPSLSPFQRLTLDWLATIAPERPPPKRGAFRRALKERKKAARIRLLKAIKRRFRI